MRLSNSYFDASKAEELDAMRKEVRQKNPKRRILYDCFHAKTDGEKVFCAKGHLLHATYGGRNLLPVLRGGASNICQDCPDYEEEIT